VAGYPRFLVLVDFFGTPVDRLATSIKERRACLTVSEVGNAAVTSGSRRIRFVPSWYRS